MRIWYLSPVDPFSAMIAVLVGLCLANGAAQTVAQENRPQSPLDPANGSESEMIVQDEQLCSPIKDPPLTAVIVDIRPLDAKGKLVSEGDMPLGCWEQAGIERPTQFIGYSNGQVAWDCHEWLHLARFCHPPIYFEDICLERCGEVPRCPAVHSAAKFAGDLFLLPVTLFVQKPCSCYRSPMPHCCGP